MTSLLFRVRALEETTSTNDEIKRALEAGEPEGLVVRARRQVAGYGRQGRIWSSPDGGLYCSWLMRPRVPSTVLSTLSLVVGLAVRRALVRLAPDAGDDVCIKWPNDVVCAAGKLCGISLETHAGGVCVGTGINVLAPRVRPNVGGKNVPAYLSDLAPEYGRMTPDEALDCAFQALAIELAPLYDEWIDGGFGALVEEFNAHASLTGNYVSMVDRAGVPLAEGTVARVDTFGCLILRDEAGAEHAVASGEAHIR